MQISAAPKPEKEKLGGISPDTVRKAYEALQKYSGHSKQESAGLLDDEDELVYMLISLRKMPRQSRKDKPIPLPLPTPLWNKDDHEVCLFVKDRAGEGHKAAKKRLAEETKAGVKKVIGISKLKAKYESHEAKRNLCSEYDIFLADNRILPVLPKLLGKSFFKKKKQPIAVDLTTKDWGAQVQKALSSTYMFNTGGTSLNIKVARTEMGSKEAVKNVLAVLKNAVAKIPKQWANVQAVYLKTVDSAALPILQLLPDDLSNKIDGKVDDAADNGMEDEESDEGQEEAKPTKAAAPQKQIKKKAAGSAAAAAKKAKAK